MADSSFKKEVQRLVGQIPEGRVMTYGQLAALVGNPNSARVVGGIAHYGDSKLPWHRVVNKQGGLASGYPGGRIAHKNQLEAEGIDFKSKNGIYVLEIEKLIWWPNN
jgi:methylated-DNA-protein-cysteine methyltransferase-like protein